MTVMMPTPRPASRGIYRPFDEVLTRVDEIKQTTHASPKIRAWIQEANNLLRSADMIKDLNRADDALENLMKATTICSVLILEHHEYPTMIAQKGPLFREHVRLQNRVKARYDLMKALQLEVKQNNERYGVGKTKSETSTEGTTTKSKDAVTRNATNGSGTPRKKPEIAPKPKGLIARASSPNELSLDGKGLDTMRPLGILNGTAHVEVDDLKARFDRLKLPRYAEDMETKLEANLQNVSRKSGAQAIDNAPPIPRVDTANLSSSPRILPRPPSPAYSPINPIAPSRRNAIPTKLPVIPNEPVISANSLFSYLQRHEISVLLLDVRNREDFGQGHINTRSIVCVEPITLRDGISGNELEELLELSPVSSEHKLFSERDKYDLIVYYDQDTNSNAFLTNAPTQERLICLRRLHEAICQYSYKKTLKRPPALLAGGINAWCELVGNSSLVCSSSKPKKSSVDLNRSTIPSMESLIKGKPSEGDFDSGDIDIEKEMAWLAKLKENGDLLTMSTPSSTEDMGVKQHRRNTSIISSGAGYARTVEDFFQQRGELFSQQSMMSSMPRASFPGLDSSTSFSAFGTIQSTSSPPDLLFGGFKDMNELVLKAPPPVRPPPAVPRKSYSGVSERPPLPIPSAPSLPLADLSKLRPTILFCQTGLSNFGNTCYMNALLQCFSGTRPLTDYFLNGRWKNYVNIMSDSKGEISNAYAELIELLWSGQFKYVRPTNFRKVVAKHHQPFDNDDQQDAEEMLTFLLTSLDEELNPLAHKPKPRELTDEEKDRRSRLPLPSATYIEWLKLKKRNGSVITDIFSGMWADQITCTECGYVVINYEKFNYWILPIPTGRDSCKLEECIDLHHVDESMNDYACNKCKAKNTKRQYTVTRLPYILVMDLKRFKGTSASTLRKVQTLVEFPMEIDLEKHVPKLTTEMMPKIENGPSLPPQDQAGPFKYSLFAVAHHGGSDKISGGHYKAFVRNPFSKDWYEYNDEVITVVKDMNKVVSRGAYLLFWVRNQPS